MNGQRKVVYIQKASLTAQWERISKFSPGSGRSPGEGNGNALQYSCPGNPMDREAWLATVHGVAKSPPQLSMQHIYTIEYCSAFKKMEILPFVTTWILADVC